MGPPCRCTQLLSLEDDALIFPVTSSYLRFEDIEKKKSPNCRLIVTFSTEPKMKNMLLK